MKNRVSLLVVAAGTVMALGGCVSSGTYQVKEQENQQLGKSLEEAKSSYNELKEKCGKVEAVRSEQDEQLKKLTAELALLKQENERLVAASRPDNLLKSLADSFAALQQRVEQLKAENAKMKQELLVPQQLQPVAPPARKAPLADAPASGAKPELSVPVEQKTPPPVESSPALPAAGVKSTDPATIPSGK